MKHSFLGIILMMLVFDLFSQNHHCAFDSTFAYKNRTNPDNRRELKNFMLESKQEATLLPKKELTGSKRANPYTSGYADYVIPIVVHVIHNGGASNISDNQINNQVLELNGYFQKYGIQFCLAKIMPDGTPFSGITRRNHALSKYKLNLDEANLMSLDLFPRDKYLNIWVVDTILDDNGVNQNQIGAGSYPDERKLGVVIRHDFFGNDVTCGTCALNSQARGKALVHELGHFFGLLHTHENGCAGNAANTCDTAGDFICDTPPMVFVNFTCRDTNTCNEKPSVGNDPIHNFMSYKSESCLNEFTRQQLEIIRANIEVYLETLIDPSNIKKVGGDSCGYITALFNASTTLICGSGTVIFKALDSLPSSRTYNWTINRGNGSFLYFYSSSTSMMTYNFTIADNYTIVLKVVGSTGTITRTKKSYVKVINCGNKTNSSRGNWFFGEYAGLEFRQNAAIPNIRSYDGNKGLTQQNVNSFEGCVVQNNNFGQLLFYGAGKKIGLSDDYFHIYDKQHNEMPNSPVKGTTTSSYGGVVVPVPGSNKRFYLFTTNIQNSSNVTDYGCRWSIIDSSLNSNNGDVDSLYKNKPLKAAPGRFFNPLDSAAYTSEGICAIPGCDSSSYWLIVNALRYYPSFSVDSTTVSRYIEVYKITSSGITHHYQYVHPEYFYAYGSIVASPDGRYISNCGLLFIFNRKTGSLKLLKDLQDKDGSNKHLGDFYHARFSPNSKILYILRHVLIDPVQGLFSKELRQYDLSTDGSFASKTTLKENAYSLQNGPDGKMYISQFNDPYISYVNKPDSLNDFVSTNKIDLKSDKIHLKLGLVTMRSLGGLPNFIDAARQIDVAKKIYHRISDCNKVFFYTNQCCAISYSWNFGDGGTASTDTVWHQYYGKRNSFFVTLVVDGITIYDTIRFGFSGSKIDGDTVICDTSNFNLYYAHNAKPGKYKYLWSAVNGSIRNNSSMTYAETKWSSPGSIKLILTDKFGCKDTATRTSAFGAKIQNNVITNPNSCSIDSITGTKPTGGNGKYRYLWQFRMKGESGWTDSDNGKDTFKDILPKIYSGTREFRRIVYSGACLSLSNQVNVVSLQNLNKIQKFVLDSNGGSCYTRLICEDIGTYYSGVAYQWQESLDKSSWSNMSGKTSYTLTLILSTEIKYYRLRAIYSPCTTYSNVLQGNQLIIERQPKDFLYCNINDSFPINFEFKVSGGKSVSYGIQWQRKHPGSSWTDVENEINDKDSEIYIKQQSTDPIVNGDSFRFRLRNIGCSVHDYAYSDVVLFRRVNPVTITKQPSDTTVNAGGRVRLKVWVNSLTNCSFSWQASKDTINWTDLSGKDKDSLILNTAGYCQDSVYYRAVMHHPCKTKYSRPAFVKVTGATKPNWDLWMKDRKSDNGSEPGDSSDWARSEDMWIRWKKDGVKPTNLSQQEIGTNLDTNWVYTTVRNKGSAYTTGPGVLHFYWTWASTGELWDRSWTYNSKNVYKNGKPMGGQINRTPIQIPSLGSSSDTTNIAFPWIDFPRIGWYDLSNTFYRNKMNVCLLARIQTCEEPKFGMTYKEKTDLKYNVNRNNNIVTRNTWVKYIWIPGRDTLPIKDTLVYDPDGSNGGGQIEFHMRPDIADGGIIKVRNNGNSGTINVCISTTTSGYFTKADIYVELSPNLMEAVGIGASITGMQWIEGNVYQISSTNGCFEGIPVYEDFEGDLNFYFAYKDANNRFAPNDKYVFAIQQFDENNREVGQCWLEIMDNPLLTPRKSIQNVIITACDWDMSGGVVGYTVPYPELSYTIYDEQEEGNIEVNESGTYELVPGDYIITTQDEINNEVIVTNLTVNSAMPTTVNSIDTVWYNCDYPDSIDYIKSCENGVMYDRFDQVVEESSSGHYTLDPQEPWYTFVCADSSNCVKYSTQINFMDIIQIPSSTSNSLTGMYNREENACCFIDLTEAECDGETLLTFGQEIQVYDMNADFLYQTNLELYGGTVLGFRFCPPYWDTSSNVIKNWYSMVIRNDECSFCRMDFMCDSVSDPEPFVILNYPSNKLSGSVNQFNWKSNTKGVVTGTEKSLSGKLPTSISVYPNPVSSEVNVKVISANSSILTIQITDAAGKPVYSSNYPTVNNSLSTRIDLSGLASGVYTIYVPELNYYYKLVIIK